ncbi:MAG: hypothetical protein OXR73_03015, partial [Myxococcales bacterium]|nr:hypothetical protein [Myxococcales bacterium]
MLTERPRLPSLAVVLCALGWTATVTCNAYADPNDAGVPDPPLGDPNTATPVGEPPPAPEPAAPV